MDQHPTLSGYRFHNGVLLDDTGKPCVITCISTATQAKPKKLYVRQVCSAASMGPPPGIESRPHSSGASGVEYKKKKSCTITFLCTVAQGVLFLEGIVEGVGAAIKHHSVFDCRRFNPWARAPIRSWQGLGWLAFRLKRRFQR